MTDRLCMQQISGDELEGIKMGIDTKLENRVPSLLKKTKQRMCHTNSLLLLASISFSQGACA